MWEFKNANFNQFREELGNVNWEECFETEDINTITDKWTETFMRIAERVISKKTVKVRPTDKNWYNNYLRRLMRDKDREYKAWTRDKSPLNLDIYRVARNKYFQECERIKIEHEEHVYANLATEMDDNPKKWWTMVGQIMNTSKKSNYPVMKDDENIYVTDKEKATAFNKTYLDSSNIDGGEHEPNQGDHELPNHELLDKIIITETDVADMIKCINVNKAYGPDNVSPRLVKEAGSAIVKVLTKLFNMSLELGKFPLIWKRANVLPIYKKAETTDQFLC